MEVAFVVEHAGCPSCAERVRTALGELGTVRDLAIDEAEDVAAVVAELGPQTTPAAVDSALADVALGSGHEYRIRPGSWRTHQSRV